jgi:hypothetical protein
MKYQTRANGVAALAIVVAWLGLAAGVTALQTSSANAGAVSPQPLSDGVQFGATYGEWSARWWQWVLSFPADQNPNIDDKGALCKEGQTGPVWFLAGTFGGDAVTRTCRIPAGKGIFFPVVNQIAFAPFPTEGIADLRGQAAATMDQVTFLKVTLDGVDLSGLRDRRVQSPAFSLVSPVGGVLDPEQCPALFVPPANPPFPRKPQGTLCNPVVSDGYWVLLSPLQAGEHKIRFRAKVNLNPPFAVDVTYNLTIAP